MPTRAIDDLETQLSGPEVSTYDVEALLMKTELLPEPIAVNSEPIVVDSEPIFIDSEPTRAGRKRKAKDMTGLSVCLCGEHAKPDDVGSIRCRKTGCATIWVSYSAMETLWLMLIRLIVPSAMCWLSRRATKELDL